MITHVVLLQPKATVLDSAMAQALEHILALQYIVPGILSIRAGSNRSTYHQGYTYGIIMRFIDEAHLDAHHHHPAHEAVVAELDQLCEHIIDFDIPEDVQ